MEDNLETNANSEYISSWIFELDQELILISTYDLLLKRINLSPSENEWLQRTLRLSIELRDKIVEYTSDIYLKENLDTYNAIIKEFKEKYIKSLALYKKDSTSWFIKTLYRNNNKEVLEKDYNNKILNWTNEIHFTSSDISNFSQHKNLLHIEKMIASNISKIYGGSQSELYKQVERRYSISNWSKTIETEFNHISKRVVDNINEININSSKSILELLLISLNILSYYYRVISYNYLVFK